jgi:hypothetical protein
VSEGIGRRQGELAAALPVSGRKPLTFLAPGEGLPDALPEASMQRLRRLKQERDAHGRVKGNFGILG